MMPAFRRFSEEPRGARRRYRSRVRRSRPSPASPTWRRPWRQARLRRRGSFFLFFLERLCADQDGGDDARLFGPHAPRVIRAALDEDVAGAQQLLAGFHDGVDLALEHDDVVHRARDVHHRIARAAVLRVAGADRLEARGAIGIARAARVGRKFHDAQDRAVLRRLESDRPVGRVGVARVGSRRALGFPEVGEREPREGGHLLHIGRDAVRDEGRAPLGVVAGEHAPHAPDHATASLAAIFLRALMPLSADRWKSQSSRRNGLDSPSFLAWAASFTFLYLPTSEFLTANTASPSRYGSPSTNTCVMTCW